MGTVALASVRSCGVTTAALALAATWPTARRVLVAELDPAGGTLAAGSGWPAEPGLVSLAAAARHGGDPALVWDHCQELPGGAAVLAGPASVDQARQALGMLGGLLGRLGELAADVLVDRGRLGGSGLDPVLAGADRLVLVTRPRLADLQALAAWFEAAPSVAERAGLVLVGDGPYPEDEVAEALGTGVLGHLPADPASAAGLLTTPASARALRVAPLVRAARSLAEQLAGELASEGAAPSSGSAAPTGSPVPLAPSAAAAVRRRWLGRPRHETPVVALDGPTVGPDRGGPSLNGPVTGGPRTNGSAPEEVAR